MKQRFLLPRLYPILSTDVLAARGLAPLAACEALLEAGARIVQLRHKGHFSRAMFEAAGRMAALAREAGALLIINDRADMAALLGAALHLGQEDLPPRDARRIAGEEMVIGFSTHNRAQLEAAASEPVDYLALGPIFTTGSKERPDPVVGLESVRNWSRLTARPLVAIGGITRANAPEVIAAGADSVAVIADLYPDPLDKTTLRQRTEEWLRILAQ